MKKKLSFLACLFIICLTVIACIPSENNFDSSEVISKGISPISNANRSAEDDMGQIHNEVLTEYYRIYSDND